jgi:cellobiose-specific phosphotransferase system component IIB
VQVGYTAYQASTVLNRLIDEFYLSTAKKADNMRDQKIAQKKLKTFLELNKNKIEELIQKSYAHLKEQIDQGEYDEFLFSPQYEVEFKEILEQLTEEDRQNVNIRRTKFIESEKVKIKARLEAASYIKAHQLTPQAVDEAMVRVFNLGNTFDLLDRILNPSAQLINKEEVMKSAKENGIEMTEGTYAALHELSTNPAFKERRKKEIGLV